MAADLSRMKTISLTTDFGARDWFVGTMKGVILGINAKATVVDITHEIPPGDIRVGAFALMASWRYFPKGTIHVAVVDPGVGSRRQAIAVQTQNGVFIGPDNGVLSWALKVEKIKTIRLLENRKYSLESISHTFHGRDIFAPAAAHISRGLPVQRLGRELKDFRRLPWPAPVKRGDEIQGEIVYLDRFGNAITNIKAEMIPGNTASASVATSNGNARFEMVEYYAAVPMNELLAVVGSCGLLELAVNGGSAAVKLGLKIGDKVVLQIKTGRGRDAIKIISGGQTGVDRAALEWALANGVAHGGWCPKGRLAEDGMIPPKFQLQETDSTDYSVRTRRNIQEADATVIFSARKTLSGGTAQTAEYAKELSKPLQHLISSMKPENAARRLKDFIKKQNISILNVAGPRASQEPKTGEFVKAVLSQVLKQTWQQ